MKIIIGFSKHRGFAPFSKLLCLYMNVDFSHVYMKFQDTKMPDPTILHAVGKGLIYLSDTVFRQHNEIVQYTFDISDETFDKIKTDFHRQAGEDYGYLQNLGVFLIDLIKSISSNEVAKNPLSEGINCSEWVSQVLDDAIGDWTDKDPNLIKPSDIRNFLKDNYGSFQSNF
jgi:hypothetical protein